MSPLRPRPRALVGGVLAAGCLFAADANPQTAQALDAGSNQPPRLAVQVCPGELVGHEQVFRQLIRSGTNQFVFVVPDGLQPATAPDGTVLLTSRDMSYHVSLRIAAPAPANGGTKEALHQALVSQYPGANSLEEFTARVADREGTGVQLRHELPRVGNRLVRVLRVPFQAGTIEFALSADARNALAGAAAWDMILLTFRSNERGPLEIIARSDKS